MNGTIGPLDHILHLLKTGPQKPERLALHLGVSEEALSGMIQMLQMRGYVQWVTTKQTGCEKCAVKGWCALPTQEGCDSLGLTALGLQRASVSDST
ncbi:hypothetical protein [Deinococcus cellulosilyticus]|uniref:Uncharacterized protein n=1 Tax=Deinococcus cellulosilyticus (strain DSM 18568 / NBRC 106333 / KACC 11606 / 5516J-15) TaxID=1223518 RepID=A0A511NAF9_DEIC1|nr:hypothetical protein [Deinococcus cellulosilyticus]GEM49812.1 hypothetical protein DC3_54470 [Deinococcus cellulosilyticus NBRC 106333 = KACC 11606]